MFVLAVEINCHLAVSSVEDNCTLFQYFGFAEDGLPGKAAGREDYATPVFNDTE